LASFHVLPNPIWCWHHFFGFLPWHRNYTLLFENALRSIEGCGTVTLPFWDQAGNPPPKWLWEPPFDSYTFQVNVPKEDPERGPDTDRQKTTRATYEYVTNPAMLKQLHDLIENAMKTTNWEDFADYQQGVDTVAAVEISHDQMHGLTGGGLGPSHPKPETAGVTDGDMLTVEYTAFDPIFWFSHCDYDRLLWEWQRRRNATDVIGLTNTFKRNDLIEGYLREPMIPWEDKKFEQMVNIRSLKINETETGIGYGLGSFHADDSRLHIIKPIPLTSISPIAFSLKAVSAEYVVWIKKIDRRFIVGSFNVILYSQKSESAPKEKVGSKFFFQLEDTMKCTRCQEKALVDFGFTVSEIHGHIFSIEIYTAKDNEKVLLDRIGNPVLEITSKLLAV